MPSGSLAYLLTLVKLDKSVTFYSATGTLWSQVAT